jgi:hypothetical protein
MPQAFVLNVESQEGLKLINEKEAVYEAQLIVESQEGLKLYPCLHIPAINLSRISRRVETDRMAYQSISRLLHRRISRRVETSSS